MASVKIIKFKTITHTNGFREPLVNAHQGDGVHYVNHTREWIFAIALLET